MSTHVYSPKLEEGTMMCAWTKRGRPVVVVSGVVVVAVDPVELVDVCGDVVVRVVFVVDFGLVEVTVVKEVVSGLVVVTVVPVVLVLV